MFRVSQKKQGVECDTGDIVFQTLSWNACDEVYGEDDFAADDSSSEGRGGFEYDETKYLIKMYGATSDGTSVSVNVLNFTPFFYIKIDHLIPCGSSLFCQKMREHIVSQLPWKLKNSIVSVKMFNKKDFWGFTNFTNFKYVRLTFKNLNGFRAGIRLMSKDVRILGVHKYPVRYKLYESNIEPFLRFIHIQGLQPSGWCIIPKTKYWVNTNVQMTSCQIDIECDWRDIAPYEQESIAPFIVASFDIECTSSHGDFPVAKKDYKKVANELYVMFQNHKSRDDIKEMIREELLAIFTQNGGNHLSRVYTKEVPPSMEYLKRLISKHVDDVYTMLCGRVSYSSKDHDYKTQRPPIKVTRENIVKNLVKKFDTIFPSLRGDGIIQIGTTVHLYGEKQCSYKNIITLGSCDDIEGAVVTSCKSEQELLLAWRDLIVQMDPDVMIGYNIFGFDIAYLHDRAEELSILQEFLKIGRIKGKSCKYEIKTLASSALGENIMKYIDMDGRILIDIMKVIQRDHKLDSFKLDNVAHHFIGMKKNDVHPNDIFRLQKGSSTDRKTIAEYCIQDCALCNLLTMKLEILANNIGMSNVCSVPLAYIFMRGQGIKIFSLVAKECRNEDFLIPTIKKVEDGEDEDGYEGAIVLEPKTGIYIDDPVCVLDYASLYPSSMISENLSHDCIVTDPSYDNLPGVEYLDVAYDIYEGSGDKKQKVGERVCRYVQLEEKGIIPRILMKLLRQRKETRRKIEWQNVVCKDGLTYKGLVSEKDDVVNIVCHDGTNVSVIKENVAEMSDAYDDFQKAVLDGLQLAYKVTANSLYGQIGAKTSPIYLKDIAACTTATGRKMIMLAKDYVEKNNEGAEVIYGDTDSIFVKFAVKDEHGNRVTGKEAIPKVRELGLKASNGVKAILKKPHDLEWEKIFYPFVLLSKKRYVANKYEWDDHKYKQNSMGIVLKRRDNANIVKKVYGGIIDIILNEQNVNKSIDFLSSTLQDLIDGKFPLEDLVITKSLRAEYDNPDKIAHKVLADRIKERDPGNAPNANDRIPYLYIQINEQKGQKILQGEKIETPEYVRQHKLKPDYEFYITRQIMNPVTQVYALVLDKLPGYRKPPTYWSEMESRILIEKEGDVKKTKEKIDELKEREVEALLFNPILTKLMNKKMRNREITDFFQVKK